MGFDALAALVFGRWYDKKGMTVLAAAVVVSSVFAIFAFSMNWVLILMGVVLWGVGMGAQESIIRAAVADLVPKGRRGTGFGIFNAGYGLAWFLGSMLMGVFYDISLPALISFSILSQLAFLPIWIGLGRKMSRS
jgi:MFS family permease